MKLYVMLMLMSGLSMAQAQDPAMKQAKKEGEALAKEHAASLKKQVLEKENLAFCEQDLLPEAEKEKKFEYAAVESPMPQSSSELHAFLQGAKKREDLDEREDFLVRGERVIQNPLQESELPQLKTLVVPEEENLQTCQESGSYQISVTQTLSVQVQPEVNKQVKHCKGHSKSDEFFWKEDANHWLEKKEKELSRNSDIASSSSYRKGGGVSYTVGVKYTHKDDVEYCNHYFMENVTVQPRKETDTWETDAQELLSHVEAKQNCKLLYINPLQGSDTRVIHAQPVTRDVWSRQLFFSCEPQTHSKW